MPRDDRTPPEKPKADVILCAVCGEPMALGSAKTDEHGKAVHQECYLCKLRKAKKTNPDI
jgi:hypothetical protein